MSDILLPVEHSYCDGGWLECPACGNNYLHQDRVEVFGVTRSQAVFITQDGVRVSHDTTGNPSREREGLRIQFHCENCEADLWLRIYQHKGNTNIGWEGWLFSPERGDSHRVTV